VCRKKVCNAADFAAHASCAPMAQQQFSFFDDVFG
jgi:hypothetical protein